MKSQLLYALLSLLFLIPVRLMAQESTLDTWWPHPIWGAGDQAGASNWITPEKVVESLKLVTTGKIYELGQIYEPDMPLYGDRSYVMRSPGTPTGGPYGRNLLVYNDEFLCTEIGQVGTQFDGPGHIGTRIIKDDGTFQDVYYNGFTGDEIYSPYGLLKIGIEHIKPYITRGILIDIAGYKNVASLEPAYEVSLQDIKGALEKQNIDESLIKPGDALFFNYGWSRFWYDVEKYHGEAPGIGLEVAKWIVDMKPSMVGSDQAGLEVNPSTDPDLAFPVHQLLINRNGIWNLENLHFEELIRDNVSEFLFIFTPIRFKGATGSPGRPIAIR